MKAVAPTAARKATNITVEAALLVRAVAAKQAELRLQSNQAALESSNAYVEQQGLPLARFRNF